MDRFFTSSQFKMPPTRTDWPQKLLYALRNGRSYLSSIRITFLSIIIEKKGFSVLVRRPFVPLISSSTRLQKSGFVGYFILEKALINSVNKSLFNISIPFPGIETVNTPAKSTIDTALLRHIHNTLLMDLKSAVPFDPLQLTNSS